ncbi:NADH:flavin oxidoreductase/NADH oxidase [Undibacterium sp. RTI2.1]|uniref:NADH:flavin oxidoreductase/NADH oxidase n=1 Tax=unclassified Undibacterium TaxID=2630295 RepID=UPI002AB3CEB8|nr:MULTISPECIES: NADH:flavin oxidoreductase/NADH oxidase [unclassified Undibacterium]MDY7540229.1 NADH:flavin oxidoreductase/NADH oxidase [Undibacterium sp. 5I1]MEB0031092.1 NADH:flavin oxidoreductase/NADH oxidase [Undibacterium sp. RTI2.1]MEB0115316.1 NADH:flavin oxidoreductase/NADH oxidase [Undibacterium sp. RTI2.2]MEB0231415.1 NADH:flavin oxidoreductase/NADH oxidase [Undibacterium sp. 10I3]MEB0257156.1 NADH:flavin oxidoreductase/NADH oxidase [Undibacterium sp. 5I1]
MSQLFSAFSIGSLTLKNRIVIAPMCQYSAKNGDATDWHMIHLGSMALSGAGLLIIEATAVEPEGRITPEDLGLWSDSNEAALKKVIHAIRAYSNMPVAIQLAHAGRKASSHTPWDGGQLISEADGGWATFAPSAIPQNVGEALPIGLDKAGMQRIIQNFVAAAKRSHNLGLDAIEVHAAHGYLLHEFLSPISNQRSDEYGGTLENRMRFPLEVFAAIRAAMPASMPVGIRISGTDWLEGGWDIDQSVVFGNALKKLGCDFVHVSSGGISPLQKIPLGDNYQVPMAEKMRKETGLPTIAVGLITDAKNAEAIVVEGKADMVALARGMLFDPRWPWHAAVELGAQVEAPKQYWRSQPRGLSTLFGDVKIGGR